MSENDAATHDEVVTVLMEWAQAIRNDWGSIDGRSSRDELNWLATCLVASHDPSLAAHVPTLRSVRDEAGVCVYGGGHWQEYCTPECVLAPAEPAAPEHVTESDDDGGN